jgi:hypothetical protein
LALFIRLYRDVGSTKYKILELPIFQKPMLGNGLVYYGVFKKSFLTHNNSMLHKKLLKQMSLIKLQFEYFLKEDQLAQKLKQ